MSFDHTSGVVESIDEKKSSKDLRDAINDGRRIIVTILQKFPVIYQEVENTQGKKFAVIVDEAHTSQTGSSAQKQKIALSDKTGALCQFAELEELEEDFILDVLENYMTYETSYQIAKATEDNHEIPVAQGVRAIRRFQSLHP